MTNRFRQFGGFILTLSCGCRAKVRDLPAKRTYMVCMSGLGHGSKLRWMEGLDLRSGTTYENQFAQSE